MLVLARGDVARLLRMPECIGLMEGALASLARGEVVLPLRPVLRVPDSGNMFALMPAYSAALPALGAKLITVFPGNHELGRDSHQGVVVLFDAETGAVEAVIDAASVTAVRTAAASGLATRVLANENVRTLGILGSGAQATTHIEAMLAVRKFAEILVWSRTRAHADALVARVEPTLPAGIAIRASSRAEDVVRASDVVCTVTASRDPVLQGEWLRAGAHVNAVGASIPAARELDTEAVRRARLFVDRRESALHEAGDLLIPMKEGAVGADHVVAEIGEILIGSRGGRRDSDEVTLFKSLGIAIEDIACAHWLVDAARRDRTGTWIEL